MTKIHLLACALSASLLVELDVGVTPNAGLASNAPGVAFAGPWLEDEFPPYLELALADGTQVAYDESRLVLVDTCVEVDTQVAMVLDKRIEQ